MLGNEDTILLEVLVEDTALLVEFSFFFNKSRVTDSIRDNLSPTSFLNVLNVLSLVTLFSNSDFSLLTSSVREEMYEDVN